MPQILGLVLAIVATILAGLVPAGVIILACDHRARAWCGRQLQACLGLVGLELEGRRAAHLVGEDAGFAVYAPGRASWRIRRRRDARVAFVSTNPRKAMTSLVVRVRVSPVWRFQSWLAARLVQLAAFVIGAGFELSIDVDQLEGKWRCTRCGDNEHQARERRCVRSPCPMVPVAPASPVVEVTSMYQGATPHRPGCGPACPCMSPGRTRVGPAKVDPA